MSSPVNSKWRAAAIILAIATLTLGSKLFQMQSELKNVFYYDVTVIVKDKETGQILKGVTTHAPESSSSDLFHQSTTFYGDPSHSHFSGIAYKPRKFGFSREGYLREEILITNKSPSNFTVYLKRDTKPSTPNKPVESNG
jgi:hypothetical protein